MKIEVEVPEALIEKLGKDALESYLQTKAEGLYRTLQSQSAEKAETPLEDTSSTEQAWQKFNKRGMSC